ncbi:MAG: ABC transporter substrate-binding protein [Candidatus Binatota bacterium]
MKLTRRLLILLFLLAPGLLHAQKIMLAHVAINPGQGLLWVARDAGLLTKYGLTADVVLIPGSPRTTQALIAGDLDYAVAGAPALLRARMQGADIVLLSALSNYSSQRVLLKPDSTIRGLKDLKGKIIGVTQYGSAGDTFIRVALKTAGLKESEVTILQMGGTPGVSQALEAGRIEVGVLGESGMLLVFRDKVRPLKGASSRELGFLGLDAPLATTERKIKGDRGSVLRFMQGYLEAIHYFKTNKAGTIRILQKYMRGLNEEHIGMWYEDYRDSLNPAPYPDEGGLRSELEQINAPKSHSPAFFVDTTILDEIKKSGFLDRLYK